MDVFTFEATILSFRPPGSMARIRHALVGPMVAPAGCP